MKQGNLFDGMRPALETYTQSELVAEMERRGFEIYDLDIFMGDAIELDRLADAIAGGETRHALDLLKAIAPGAPEPATTLFLRDLRANQPEA